MKRFAVILILSIIGFSPARSIDTLLQNRVDTLIVLQAQLLELDSLSKNIEKRSIMLREKLAEIPTFSLAHPLVSLKGEVPVVIISDTIWVVSSRVGVLTVNERARGIENRIESLIELDDFNSDSLKIVEDELEVLVVYKQINLFGVSDIDALPYNTTSLDLALRIKNSIIVIVSHHNANYKEKGFLYKIAGVVIVIVVLILLIKLISYIINKLKMKVISMKDTRLKGVKVKNIEIVNSSQEINLIFFVLKILKIILIVILLYIALPIVFSFFAFTRGWANLLLGYVTDPLSKAGMALINYIPSLFSIVVIYMITKFFVRFLKIIFVKLEKGEIKLPGFFPEWAMPTYRIIAGISYIFMFIVIFPYLPGSDSPVFKGVSVFLGVLFSLGSTSAIANLVAGLVITYMRPFKIGDRVQIGDTLGNVVEKNLLVTRLLTPKNEEVTIPNANILTAKNVNFSTTSKNMGLILHTQVTIGYDVPWQQVHELLIKAAENTDGIIKDKKPFVLQTALNDFYISYELNVYTDKPKHMAIIYSRLHQNIQDEFNKANVEILSPHYEVNRFEDDDLKSLRPSKKRHRKDDEKI
jgi:small-conductance mechanosensitive channel